MVGILDGAKAWWASGPAMDRKGKNAYAWKESEMKKELLGYLAGLCQAASAASAALLAAAVIMPEARTASLCYCGASAVMGGHIDYTKIKRRQHMTGIGLYLLGIAVAGFVVYKFLPADRA